MKKLLLLSLFAVAFAVTACNKTAPEGAAAPAADGAAAAVTQAAK